MKHSTHTFERDPHAGTSALGYLCTKRNKQRLNIIPFNVCTFRFFEYFLECTMLLFIHASIVSHIDTMSSDGKQIFEDDLTITKDKLRATLPLECLNSGVPGPIVTERWDHK
jgi:hypothetical protein